MKVFRTLKEGLVDGVWIDDIGLAMIPGLRSGVEAAFGSRY